MSDWAGGFLTGFVVAMPLFGSLGALAIVLVMGAKRGDEDQ